MRVQFSGAPPPKNLGEQKTSKIHNHLRQLLSLTANIFLEDEAINKR